MVAARISRQSGEVVAGAGAPASITRVDVEVLSEAEATNSVDAARVSRQSIEVFARRSPEASITRVDVEIVSEAEAATTDAARVSRQSVEVFINVSPRAALTRLDIEVASEAETLNAVDPIRVSRISGEAFARRGSAGGVAPLALSADAELFLHDWADLVTLRSSYLTDVTIAGTGAESRVGNRLKPARSMDIVWRQTREEYDENDLSRLDRLYVFLRRLTADRFQVPLYPDLRTLDAAYTALDTALVFDTSRGRWFLGARVAVVRLTYTGSYLGHTYHTIASITSGGIEVSPALGVTVPAYSFVVPMLDCEVALEVEALHEVGCLAEVSLTVDEVPGVSQLPPTRADTPAGAPTHDGVPILAIDPDWSEGVRRGRSRQGVEFTSGRARGVSPLAARSRETHELSFVNERPEFWQLVEFFDTRRGRLRSFWHVDHERIWQVAALDPNFISVVGFGDFADFQEELEGAQVGLVMSDGTFYVRDAVTVQQVLTVYRITVDPPLPALVVADVIRVARARRVRFDSDEMEETWTTAGLAETKLKVIEVLEEKDVTL